MAKSERYSVLLGSPQMLQIGDQVTFNGKKLTVTSIGKVEFVSSSLVSVSGNGKAI